MVVILNYGDDLPDPPECDQFGNLVFRVLKDDDGLLPANDPNIRYSVPIAKDYEGEFLANNLQLCEQDEVIRKHFILRGRGQKISEPVIAAQWAFSVGGSGTSPEETPLIDEQLWCNPMGLQGSDIFCLLFYTQAPNWRVIEFKAYDAGAPIVDIILDGDIVDGRFIGLPDEYFYRYPIQKLAGGPYYHVEFKYCLQAGDALNDIWPPVPFEEPIGDAIDIAACENEAGDGNPCTGDPPEFG